MKSLGEGVLLFTLTVNREQQSVQAIVHKLGVTIASTSSILILHNVHHIKFYNSICNLPPLLVVLHIYFPFSKHLDL